MIQRIQTVFLFISTVLTIVMIFAPISEIRLTGGENLRLYSLSLKDIDNAYESIHSAIPILILLPIVAVVSFLCIFLYKKRALQMRLCVFNILLLILVSGLIFFNYITIRKKYGIVSPSFIFLIIFPVVDILILLLANRAIRKDERLVKSHDRLR